jgi:hypothetical protein
MRKHRAEVMKVLTAQPRKTWGLFGAMRLALFAVFTAALLAPVHLMAAGAPIRPQSVIVHHQAAVKRYAPPATYQSFGSVRRPQPREPDYMRFQDRGLRESEG